MSGAVPTPPAISLHDRILREAAGLFASRGYHQVATSEIAVAAKVELSTLFHYFASKAEIMNKILKHDLDAAVEAAERQLGGAGSPARRLYRYLVEDLSVALRSPYAVGINATSGLLKELDFAGARARSQRLGEARAALIGEGIEAGEFVEIDPRAASKAIEWTIEGSLAEGALQQVDDHDEVAHAIAGLCLRALLIDVDSLESIRNDLPAAVDEYPLQ